MLERCRRGQIESLPEFLDERPRVERVEEVDNKLIIQGAEQGREDVRDGFGWTIAIMEDTGQMVLTASGDLVGNVAFGVCTPQ